ncbi:MAG: hypothetical protein HEP70_14120 [Rhodobiaceae bacterium]|nr:hypothetical protein [Rhodobiaceae bacterium]
MRLVISFLVAMFAMTGAALADPFANFYGNTVSIENPAGTRSVLINNDGTYSQVLPDGTSADGTWSVDGENACFATGADTPPYCVEAVSRNVGDTWDLTAPDGTAEKATLVAGR